MFPMKRRYYFDDAGQQDHPCRFGIVEVKPFKGRSFGRAILLSLL
jgi:hypothetical protein